MWLTYSIIAFSLVVLELIYFKIADRYNIIDKPNERSHYSTIVLRGGGVIFLMSLIVWSLTPFTSLTHDTSMGEGSVMPIINYWPFVVGLVLISGVSFWDDVHSLHNSVRLMAQFTAMGLTFYQLIIDNGQLMIEHWCGWILFIVTASIVFVGATNIINFMDGINGITAGYALAVLVPLLLIDNGHS